MPNHELCHCTDDVTQHSRQPKPPVGVAEVDTLLRHMKAGCDRYLAEWGMVIDFGDQLLVNRDQSW
jgi:hypothetical protein